MQIGAVYPQHRAARRSRALCAVSGSAVEELGFGHLLAYDHVLGAVHADRTPPLTGPYTEQDPFHDPFVMFAYLAAITERTPLCHRDPDPPAAPDGSRRTAGRRRRTPVRRPAAARSTAIGWNHVEYEALGQDFRTRGARQEEQIALLRKLFTEPVVDFSGRFDRIDRAALVPKPSSPVPIWLGGFGDKAFDRAARLADGFIFFGGGVDHSINGWSQVRGRVHDLGRSVDDFGADYVVLPSGGLSGLASEADAWKAAGGTHLSVATMGLGLDSVDGHIDYLKSVAKALSLS